jgi:hypothetical protein
MPRLTFEHPIRHLFLGESAKDSFKEEVRRIVITYMEGDDYQGQPLHLTTSHVTVVLRPQPAENVSSESTFFVTITGYDYPSRMDSIEWRLARIAEEIKGIIERYIDMNLTERSRDSPDVKRLLEGEVEATFIPYKDGCWASS